MHSFSCVINRNRYICLKNMCSLKRVYVCSSWFRSHMDLFLFVSLPFVFIITKQCQCCQQVALFVASVYIRWLHALWINNLSRHMFKKTIFSQTVAYSVTCHWTFSPTNRMGKMKMDARCWSDIVIMKWMWVNDILTMTDMRFLMAETNI